MGYGVGNVVDQGEKFVESFGAELLSNVGLNQSVNSSSHLVVEVEAHDGPVNLKRRGITIQVAKSQLNKAQDQPNLQVQLLEKPLALIFAHGVAESDGVRKKKKYGPK